MHNKYRNLPAVERLALEERDRKEAFAVDEGLRSFMLSVYNYMSLGVAFTGALAMLVATNETLLQQLNSPLFWLLFIAVLGLGLLSGRIMSNGSVLAGQACFWGYAACWGLLLGPLFAVYAAADPMMIVRAFFITGATFLGMSLYGYTTKRNLSPAGSFLAMACIGLLIAMLANAFIFQDGLFQMAISAVVVIVFSLLTAVETQRIRNSYDAGDVASIRTRKAIFGAFSLYGSFVALFVHILSLLSLNE